MALPRTLPVMPYFPLGLESVIVPPNFDPVCVQCSVNLPTYAPLYVPDQVPARWGELEAFTPAVAVVPLRQKARRAATPRTGITSGILRRRG
jgi:hypothetical protein